MTNNHLSRHWQGEYFTEMNTAPQHSKPKTASFGEQDIPLEEKPQKIQEVFNQSAQHYDLMNFVMSLGMHSGWKRKVLESAHIFPGDWSLDLACGTCDITEMILEKFPQSYVVATDPNASMLEVGRDRLLDKGQFKAVEFVQGYAENLPFPNHRFENVFCAFGFRNFTDQAKGISECVRVLKPGGQLTILEFSQPKNASIDFVFHEYAKWIPSIGDFIAQNADSYQYLVESIQRNMSSQSLAELMSRTGLASIPAIEYFSGLIYIQRGIKC